MDTELPDSTQPVAEEPAADEEAEEAPELTTVTSSDVGQQTETKASLAEKEGDEEAEA